jgi:hypothetical protein
METPAPSELTVEQAQEVKRGGCLSAFLIGMIALNPLVALYYLYVQFFPLLLRLIRPVMRIPRELVPDRGILRDFTVGFARSTGISGIVFLDVLILAGVLNTIFAIAIWKWKRWGMVGLLASAVVILVINLMAGLGIAAVFGLGGPILLGFLLRNVWKFMD